jgi:biopolymer transport protein ExbD
MSPKTGHAEISQRAIRLPEEEEPNFQIAPMIDILLVLLIFFMTISSTEVLQRSTVVNLPGAKEVKLEHRTPGQAIINVMWVPMNNIGSIELDNHVYAQPVQMLDVLRAKAQASPSMRVFIRADRDVRYEYLQQVMRVAGQAGIGKITFAVIPPPSGN